MIYAYAIERDGSAGYWSNTTGLACYARYMYDLSDELGHCTYRVYVFDADGNPVAWGQVNAIEDLADLVERGCTYRFDYLYGDAEAFGLTVDVRSTLDLDELPNAGAELAGWADALEADEGLYYDDGLLAISEGSWVIEPCFPDQLDWLNQEAYEKIKAEVDAWPEWKKQAYNGLVE